ncbi:DNA/RNA non-specific endonuclease [Leifsonia sp. YIM 134122]|uniref:DNA/RNA non-specific endonuclease n=1 Tax=Leifsonia stereocauli TaxID=3134136 RepID=A0ABU9W4Q9_9MICO
MGFDPDFLAVPVPFPTPAAVESETAASAEAESAILDYVHFTVDLDRERRLARVTGVNIDGSAIVDVPRGDDWRFDERVPVDWQTGPAVYASNDLDRGHLVRRRDPVWGPDADTAESDTFHFTNAAPQAATFNQGKQLWLGLEDHVFTFASVNELKLSVFTAPVLGPDDPPYRGIRIPLRFWKVVAWVSTTDAASELFAAGFILDQSALVRDHEAERILRVAGEPPLLGPYRTFQVPIADIAAATGLDLDELIAADRMPQSIAAGGWRELTEPGDILL